MIETKTREKKQGIDEQTMQSKKSDRVVVKNRVKEVLKTAQKKAIIDKINFNKAKYRSEHEHIKAEKQRLEMKTTPQMEHVENLQEEKQTNPTQDILWKGAKATERYRMGKEAADIAISRKRHAFNMREVDANERVLKAANNPHQKKEDDLDKQLTKQEEDMKKVFKDPNIPPDKKIEFFKNQIRGTKNAPLKDIHAIEKRGRRLIKEIKPQQRKILKKQLHRIARSIGR